MDKCSVASLGGGAGVVVHPLPEELEDVLVRSHGDPAARAAGVFQQLRGLTVVQVSDSNCVDYPSV